MRHELPALTPALEDAFFLAGQELQNTGEVLTVDARQLFELVQLGYLVVRRVLLNPRSEDALPHELRGSFAELRRAQRQHRPARISMSHHDWFFANGWARGTAYDLTEAGKAYWHQMPGH